MAFGCRDTESTQLDILQSLNELFFDKVQISQSSSQIYPNISPHASHKKENN